MCRRRKNYSFNIIETISSSIIPEEKDIEINVKTTDNDSEYKKAICKIKQSNKYTMTCKIEGVICPQDIIIDNNSIQNSNISLFSPDTIFFNDFNRRTFTIKVGKLNKIISDNNNQYNFSFTDNTITGN